MKITHEVEIKSTLDSVWAITTEVESWPKWNPNVEEVTRKDEGRFEIGSSAIILQKGLPPTCWKVTALEESRQFTWEASVYGMKMKASHILRENEASVSNRLIIDATGILVYLLWPILKLSFYKSLEKENLGLKKFIEQNN